SQNEPSAACAASRAAIARWIVATGDMEDTITLCGGTRRARSDDLAHAGRRCEGDTVRDAGRDPDGGDRGRRGRVRSARARRGGAARDGAPALPARYI